MLETHGNIVRFLLEKGRHFFLECETKCTGGRMKYKYCSLIGCNQHDDFFLSKDCHEYEAKPM